MSSHEFIVTGDGTGTIKALEGWGWAQENAESTVSLGWGNPELTPLQGFGLEGDQTMHFPPFGLNGSGQRVSYGGTFDVPAFSLSGYGGGTQEDATLNLSLTAATTVDELGRTVNLNIDIRLPYEPTINFPRFTLTGVGRTEQYGYLTKRIPGFTLSGYGAGNASMDFPPFTVDGVGLVEETGSLVDGDACGFNNVFPLCMWSVTASGTTEPQGRANVDVPAFSVTTTIPASMDIPAFHVHAEAA